MRKTIYLILFILFLAQPLYGESQPLRLRMGHHKDFLRIVLEGAKPLLDEAIVNQKAKDILVTFPNREISIEVEGGLEVPYKKVGVDAILFSPGNFRGMKVFTLSHPDRLIIDVYLQGIKRRDETELRKLKTVIIDPGHGGYEYGLVRNEHREKSVVLNIAKKLAVIVGRGSTRAILTRESDLYMPLSERVKLTSERDADVFISLHIGNHDKIIIYVPVITESVPPYIQEYLVNRGQGEYLDKTLTLARVINKAMASDFGEEMVVMKPLPYTMLSRIEAAAVMIELPSFESVNYTEELKSHIAHMIHRGLYIYEEVSAD